MALEKMETIIDGTIQHQPGQVAVVRYDGGWDIAVIVGIDRPTHRRRRIELRPEQAQQLIDALKVELDAAWPLYNKHTAQNGA